MNLKTHRKLVSVSCLLFALLTFANTNGENQEGISRTRNRSKRQITPDKPRDCYDVLQNGETISGVYRIYPDRYGYDQCGVNVYCDLQTDGGGWTVFLQRKLQDPQLNFTKTFDDYANFFGNPNGEYWLGNLILNAITSNRLITLRAKANYGTGEERTAEWGRFHVGNQQLNFRLLIDGYNTQSTLGDGMTPTEYNGRNSSDMRPFSTYDQVNGDTPKHCLSDYGNGGWWYNDCLGVNPTAPLSSFVLATDRATWFYWNPSGGASSEVLSEIQFKIRPNFNLSYYE